MTLVLAHGCFDLLHLGHIRHLQEAKKLGSKLLVSVTDDAYVGKGVGRPHFTALQRVEALQSLSCVDQVVINQNEDAVPVIKQFKPQIYVKGIDYRDRAGNSLQKEKDAIESVGGKLMFTSAEKFSSSRLINSEKFPPETLQYLEKCREARFLDKILDAFNAADRTKIAFVGERIIDEYIYVRGLGRPSKEMMLAAQKVSDEFFFGGVEASAKHAEWKNVKVCTSSKSIRKTRLVEVDFNRKLFDLYSETKIDLTEKSRKHFQEDLKEAIADSDIVIVNDFGHGLIGHSELELLEKSKFLAVNAQTNAGNYGFNCVTKYHAAQFVCVDDTEARLATGLAEAAPEEVIHALAGSIDCDNLVITHGRFGSTFCHNTIRSDIYVPDCHGTAPAFILGGIDTMGAGDAALATMAPLIKVGLPIDASAFVGNVAGAIKTTIVGHRKHVSRDDIVNTVKALLA